MARPKRGRQRAGTYGVKGKETSLKLLVAYESKTSYQPRYDFYGIGARSVRTNIGKEVDKAVVRALPPIAFNQRPFPNSD